MKNLLPTLLPHLKATRLPGFDLGDYAVLPGYHGQALSNLPGSVCQWLRTPPLAAPLAEAYHQELDDHFQHVVVIVADGMGIHLLQEVLAADPVIGQGPNVWQRLLDDALLAPLTSIVPSTTAAALTTLWTGRTPLEHGIIGYELWLKEYGLIANMISHAPASFSSDLDGLRRAGFQPENFLPLPRLGSHLLANGVASYAFQPASIAHSGLSRMILTDVNVVPYRTQSDLWVSLKGLLLSKTQERTYTYVYWGSVDELGHRFGPQDERIQLECTAFGVQLEQFLAAYRRVRRQNTLFLLTADHGQIATPPRPEYDLKNHPALLACLAMMPSGENRLPYLFLRPGAEETARQYIQETWPGQFRLFPASQIMQSGLLGDGPMYPAVADRLGDWVAIPQDNAYWWWANKPNTLQGRHGGLSEAEMLVPLMAFVV